MAVAAPVGLDLLDVVLAQAEKRADPVARGVEEDGVATDSGFPGAPFS